MLLSNRDAWYPKSQPSNSNEFYRPHSYLVMSSSQPASGVDTLRPLVDLQPRLGHFRVLEELQGHPDEMAPDLANLPAGILRRHEQVVDVARLDALGGQVAVVVFEILDCKIVRDELHEGDEGGHTMIIGVRVEHAEPAAGAVGHLRQVPSSR